MPSTPTYADINLGSAEANLQSVAVRTSADLIASLASEMPVHVYSGEGSSRQRRPTPGYLEDPAGDGYGLPDWLYQLMMSWMLRGNVYGDIVDQSRGYPTQVVLHHPDEAGGWIDSEGKVRWSVAGKPVENPDRFMHRRINPMPGRVLGLSVIGLHAAQIGLTLTATQFGLQWFKDGAHPSGMLTTEADLKGDGIQKAKDAFMAAVFGSREPLVMGKGWKYESIQVAPDESQFLETQGYTEAQCARMFGPGLAEVLGYETGGSMTYANVESRMSHLLVLSVNRWFRRAERLLTSMLPSSQYARIDRDGLLQSTTLERYKAHESALRNRWKTVNEVRADEELASVEWGDEPNSTTSPAAAGGGQDDEPTGAEAPKKDGT